VALYLPQEREAIKSATGRDAEEAIHRELGMSYAAIGVAVASALNLPNRLAKSMTRIPGAQAHESMTDEEKLGSLATLANGITDALAAPASAGDKRTLIRRLLRSYGRHFSAVDVSIDSLIGKAVTDLRKYSRTFQLDLPGSAFVAGLGEWRIDTLVASDKKGVAAASASAGLIDTADSDLDADELPEATLTRGLHEITSLLVTEFTLDDVLRVILETMYRALGVGRTRAFFLLKDPTAATVHFRFGLGQSAGEMRAWMEVPLDHGDDIFSLVVRAQKDLVVRDSSAPEMAPLLPEWYRRQVTTPRYIVLLPLVVDNKSLGLFYMDGDASSAGVLTSPVLNYLKVLRGQAVVAIHQKNLQAAARRR